MQRQNRIDIFANHLAEFLQLTERQIDQVATDLKLWCKDTVSELLTANRQLQSALVETAQNNQDAVMPGYTHLQRAQPVTFAHWCLAYVEMLARDESRLQDALKRLDVSPLGCGALAGTAYEIDREQLAGWLGFASATRNSLDSVSDRDHVLELLSAAAIGMVHLSRFAEDQLSLPVSDCWYGSNTPPCEYLQDRVFYLQSRDKNAPLWAIGAHCTEGYRGLISPSGKALIQPFPYFSAFSRFPYRKQMPPC